MAKLTFYGGIGMITGANFLLEADGMRILIDCGFFQGCDICDEKNSATFPYDPASIDVLLVTHAHIDHTGRIPYLVKSGFRGKIVSTPPTKEISELLFFDSIEIEQNKKKVGGRSLLYDKEDVRKTMMLWSGIPYHEAINLSKNLCASFK